jgi:STE24 endopeptidase
MNAILLLILILITVGFVFDLILELLNLKHISPILPPIVENRYNQDSYTKAQSYLREHGYFGLLFTALSFVVIFLLFLFGGFSWLNDLVYSISGEFCVNRDTFLCYPRVDF